MSTFGGVRQGALLKLVVVLLALAVMCGINNFFKRVNALKVSGDTYLLKEIHCPLEIWELALVLRSKEAITLDMRLKRLLWRSERSWRW
jgi:hypothetical protein